MDISDIKYFFLQIYASIIAHISVTSAIVSGNLISDKAGIVDLKICSDLYPKLKSHYKMRKFTSTHFYYAPTIHSQYNYRKEKSPIT